MTEIPIDKRLKMRCKTCKSEDVYRDAWSSWSIEKQEWVLEHVYDDGYCNVCEGETRIEEIRILYFAYPVGRW